MKKVLFVAAVAAFVFAVACGSSDPCKSPCANDPVLTADQLKACQTPDTTVKCYAESKALSSCGSGLIVCGADGKTDSAATTTKVTASCATQIKAYSDCLTKCLQPDSGC